jgi:hypothetical protein
MRINFGEWLPDQPSVIGALTEATNVYPVQNGYAPMPSAVSLGTATGQRYSITGNSIINTNGAATTYLPGGTAGATATGGQYL